METLKKILRALIFPHIAIVIALFPIAAAMLIWAFVFEPDNAIINYVSYVISAYSLTVICFRIPDIIRSVQKIKDGNKYVARWTGDTHFRMKMSLGGGFLFNASYAVFQLGLGIYNNSVWFYALAAYYFFLSLMRVSLFSYTAKNEPGKNPLYELCTYRLCGMALIPMNIALAVIITYLTLKDQSVASNEIITIANAAFSFTALTLAIVNVVKYKKYKNPIYSASKAISLIVALVSMITLEDTMLASFGGEETAEFRLIMMAMTGFCVMVAASVIAVSMIVVSQKQINELKKQKKSGENNG